VYVTEEVSLETDVGISFPLSRQTIEFDSGNETLTLHSVSLRVTLGGNGRALSLFGLEKAGRAAASPGEGPQLHVPLVRVERLLRKLHPAGLKDRF